MLSLFHLAGNNADDRNNRVILGLVFGAVEQYDIDFATDDGVKW
jgi:hypothetical protein